MALAPFFHRAITIFVIFFLCGCSKVEVHPISFKEAHDKFLKICEEELSYSLITKQVGETYWIYFPTKEQILTYKTSPEGPSFSNEGKAKPILNFIDVQFKENSFYIEYDIGIQKTYTQSFGYLSSYSDKFQEIQSNILSALQQSFVGAEVPPKFIVLTFSNIETGIEMETIQYFDDFKGAYSIIPTISQDEYVKRLVSEIRGNQEAIGDSRGKHIDYRDISMSDFLAKQMVNRINFKFQHSAFPPSENAQEEVLSAVKETLKPYNFTNFDAIYLFNLSSNSKTIIESTKIDL